MSFPFEPSPQNPAASGVLTGRTAPAPEAPLDTIAKSVGDLPHRQKRMDRFRWQRHAVGLLGFDGISRRFAGCRWNVVRRVDGVDVVTSIYTCEDGSTARRASFKGLQTCGSVWLCPCCSARISEVRRAEMNVMLSWARAQGYAVQMITLTARHGRADVLADLLERMKLAKQAWHRHSAYKALKGQVVGHVTATEVTGGGAHGWHPHFHFIILTKDGLDEEGQGRLRRAWLASLAGAGLDGVGAAFHVQDASEAGDYITKWGAAEEVTLTATKQGRKGGRTPAQLLAASCDDGDKAAGALWRDYATTFHGRVQLMWSRGLKKACGVDEVSDEEAAEDASQEQVREDTANISHENWTRGSGRRLGARYRRGRILNAAEDGGGEGVARVVAAGGEDPCPGEDPGALVESDDGSPSGSVHPGSEAIDDRGDQVQDRGNQVRIIKHDNVSVGDSRSIVGEGCQPSHAHGSSSSSEWPEGGYMSAWDMPVITPSSTINRLFPSDPDPGGKLLAGHQDGIRRAGLAP